VARAPEGRLHCSPSTRRNPTPTSWAPATSPRRVLASVPRLLGFQPHQPSRRATPSRRLPTNRAPLSAPLSPERVAFAPPAPGNIPVPGNYTSAPAAVLEVAGELAAEGQALFRAFSAPRQLLCLPPGPYTALLFSAQANPKRAYWDGASLAVAVADKVLMAPTTVRDGQNLALASFEVPAAADAALARGVAGRGGGSWGVQADVSISDLEASDVKGAAWGALLTALAGSMGTVVQNVGVVDVRNATTAVAAAAPVAGRRLSEYRQRPRGQQQEGQQQEGQQQEGQQQEGRRGTVAGEPQRHSPALSCVPCLPQTACPVPSVQRKAGWPDLMPGSWLAVCAAACWGSAAPAPALPQPLRHGCCPSRVLLLPLLTLFLVARCLNPVQPRRSGSHLGAGQACRGCCCRPR
jgi:hypothetical protein